MVPPMVRGTMSRGIERRLTKPNHPWTNGQVERMNRTIKDATVIRTFFAPDRIETLLPSVLARTAAVQQETGVPMRLHCCQSVYEFETLLALRGHSPLGWLENLGLLTDQAILPHGIYIPGHPQVSLGGDTDMQRLVASRTNIAHCPVAFGREGEEDLFRQLPREGRALWHGHRHRPRRHGGKHPSRSDAVASDGRHPARHRRRLLPRRDPWRGGCASAAGPWPSGKGRKGRYHGLRPLRLPPRPGPRPEDTFRPAFPVQT